MQKFLELSSSVQAHLLRLRGCSLQDLEEAVALWPQNQYEELMQAGWMQLLDPEDPRDLGFIWTEPARVELAKHLSSFDFELQQHLIKLSPQTCPVPEKHWRFLEAVVCLFERSQRECLVQAGWLQLEYYQDIPLFEITQRGRRQWCLLGQTSPA